MRNHASLNCRGGGGGGVFCEILFQSFRWCVTLRFIVSKLTCMVGHLRASEGGEWQQKTTTDKKIQKKSEINSGFESQVKIKRSQIHTEGKRERERERERWTEERSQIMEDCHWLSSLRGRLRQTHGPSSESHQSHRDDQFGHYWQTDVVSGHLTHLALNIVWYSVRQNVCFFFSLLLLRITWEGNIALWANHRHMQTVQSHKSLSLRDWVLSGFVSEPKRSKSEWF